MEEYFANYPASIKESKADKTQKAAHWSPRDALISILREIDKGERKVDTIFIAMGEFVGDDGDTNASYRAAGKNHYEISGMMHRAMYMFEQD